MKLMFKMTLPANMAPTFPHSPKGRGRPKAKRGCLGGQPRCHQMIIFGLRRGVINFPRSYPMSVALVSFSAPQPRDRGHIYNGSARSVRANTGRQHDSVEVLQSGPRRGKA